jgi:hypothetical protein
VVQTKYYIAVTHEDWATIERLLAKNIFDPNVATIVRRGKAYEVNPVKDNQAFNALTWEGNIILDAPELCQ